METHKRRFAPKTDLCDKVILTYEGRSIDVTEFLPNHPGGRELLLKYAGSDVTGVMNDPERHQHSSAAYRILKTLPVTTDSDDGKIRDNGDGGVDGNQPNLMSKQIDWDKPLASQVSVLRERYCSWVHEPVHQDIRFFKSDILEGLTMCSWYVIPTLWLPIMLYFLWCSYDKLQTAHGEIWLPWLLGGVVITKWHIGVLFLLGVFLWTFLEYVFHRWLFHLCPPAGSPVLIVIHFLIHGQHHKSPMDKRRLVFPPVPAFIVTYLLWNAYSSVFSAAMCSAVFAGSIFGYVVYDLMHYYLHHGTPWLPYLKDLKRHHMKHHYGCHNSGFGISSKFWDMVFGTMVPSK